MSPAVISIETDGLLQLKKQKEDFYKQAYLSKVSQ